MKKWRKNRLANDERYADLKWLILSLSYKYYWVCISVEFELKNIYYMFYGVFIVGWE